MRNPFRRAPLQRTPAAFDAADQDLLEVLEELEQAKNYSAWILDMIGPHISGRILEVGAGRGTYSTYFADHGHLTALEPSEAHSAALRERLKDYPNAVVITAQLDGTAAPGSYDTVVLLNVLEHIPDDHRALRRHLRVARPGRQDGAVGAGVRGAVRQVRPAHRPLPPVPRNELLALVHNVGFQQVTARYTNMPGFFAWWLLVRVLGRTPTAVGWHPSTTATSFRSSAVSNASCGHRSVSRCWSSRSGRRWRCRLRRRPQPVAGR